MNEYLYRLNIKYIINKYNIWKRKISYSQKM